MNAAMELIETGRFFGEEFCVWLWMQGLKNGGRSGHPEDQSAVFVDDSVTFVTERGDVKSLTLSKGNPAESREAFEALARGMRPSKAKIRILSGDMEWICTLNTGTLDTGAMKIPASQAKDAAGRIADRIFLIQEGVQHIERRYAAFLGLRQADSEALEAEIQAWIRSSLGGFLEDGGGDAPWEN